MSIKKYTNNAWVDIPYKKYETATDTYTSLPQTIIGDGQNISAYTIKGNMTQSGTPTPSNPIYPQEVGDLVTTGEHAGEYEIPISSGGTTTPVYLGQVQSTRKIKKLVLTGTNADGVWTASSTYTGSFYLNVGNNGIIREAMCDRATNVRDINNYNYGNVYVEMSVSNILINLWLFDTAITLTDFKSYLAAQYAAGTPVTVWYVLKTEETGTVNEPLRKIGDYADELTSTQAGVTIPTSGSPQSFDVSTTLKPSEVSLTYHGWHEHSDKKKSANLFDLSTVTPDYYINDDNGKVQKK